MQQALRIFLLLTAGALLAGCAIHTKEQIAAVRAAGVAPETVRKISGRGILSPEDLIELRKRKVDDAMVIRHIEQIGVNYVVQKDDIKAMRAAGVRPSVISATVRASNRFVSFLYAPRAYSYSFGYWNDPFYSPFYSPYYGAPYCGPWGPYGGRAFGFGYGRWR